MRSIEYFFDHSPDDADGWSFFQVEGRATIEGDADDWTITGIELQACRSRNKRIEYRYDALKPDHPLYAGIVKQLQTDSARDIEQAWLDALDDEVAYGDPNDEHRHSAAQMGL